MNDEQAIVPSPEVFWNYEDLIVFGGALLPALIAGRLIAALAARIAGVDKGVEGFILQFVAYGCWFLALYGLFRFKHGRPFWESLSWNPDWRRIGVSFLLGIAVAIGLIVTSALVDMPQLDATPMQELLSGDLTLLLVGVFSTTLGPLCEELAFRGFLMPLFSRSFGITAGIVLATVPFAVAHAPQYAFSWRHVALVGLAGIAFGWTRFRTGSTAAATAMHSAYNLTIFAGLMYERHSW